MVWQPVIQILCECARGREPSEINPSRTLVKQGVDGFLEPFVCGKLVVAGRRFL